MKISVVIPNYNGESILGKNLPKVIDSLASYDFEIIIVDDCSADNSVKIIKEFVGKNKNAKFFKNSKNMGFSSTVNNGAKQAKGDILLLLNTDVIPKKGFIEPIIDDFRDDKIFAVGCMDESIENGSVILRGRGSGKWRRGFLLHSAGDINKSNTLWVSGGSGAFRRSVWEKLGGLDQIYDPFYWEDIDLSYRALKAGYKLIFEKRSVVIHEHSKGAIKSNYSASDVKTISYRNQFFFVWKNATDSELIFEHLLWLPFHLARAILRFDTAFLVGFGKALAVLPLIFQKRKQIKALIKSSDKEVISQFNG